MDNVIKLDLTNRETKAFPHSNRYAFVIGAIDLIASFNEPDASFSYDEEKELDARVEAALALVFDGELEFDAEWLQAQILSRVSERVDLRELERNQSLIRRIAAERGGEGVSAYDVVLASNRRGGSGLAQARDAFLNSSLAWCLVTPPSSETIGASLRSLANAAYFNVGDGEGDNPSGGDLLARSSKNYALERCAHLALLLSHLGSLDAYP